MFLSKLVMLGVIVGNPFGFGKPIAPLPKRIEFPKVEAMYDLNQEIKELEIAITRMKAQGEDPRAIRVLEKLVTTMKQDLKRMKR